MRISDWSSDVCSSDLWASKWWRAEVMAKLSKKAKKLAETVDSQKLHPVDEAISLVKANATSKFDETVEVAINLGVDPRHADQRVRGGVTLHKGNGTTVRVARKSGGRGKGGPVAETRS